jgi:sugar phosphate isomerase/epimerase
VPISAPQGYPELYQIASFDEGARALARIHLRRNIAFAAEMGASAVVLHAGRVMCRGFFRRHDLKRRIKNGRKMVDILKKELETILPDLENAKVTLGLENLPYLEGFPAEHELSGICGEWVKPWLDTGHDHVRTTNGWKEELSSRAKSSPLPPPPVGLHINDSKGGDDHLPPGEGEIDFTAMKETAEKAKHLVFEPREDVSEKRLAAGLTHVRSAWGCGAAQN